MTGGVLRNLTYSLIGPQVMRSLEMFNADWAFVAAGGYTLHQGVTTSNIPEVEVKRTMLEHAQRTALLVDHTKFGNALSLTVAPLRQINVLITDVGLSETKAQAIAALSVEVIRV